MLAKLEKNFVFSFFSLVISANCVPPFRRATLFLIIPFNFPMDFEICSYFTLLWILSASYVCMDFILANLWVCISLTLSMTILFRLNNYLDMLLGSSSWDGNVLILVSVGSVDRHDYFENNYSSVDSLKTTVFFVVLFSCYEFLIDFGYSDRICKLKLLTLLGNLCFCKDGFDVNYYYYSCFLRFTFLNVDDV